MTARERVVLADLAEGVRCFDPSHRSYSGDSRFDVCQFRDQVIRSGRVRDWMGREAVVGMAVDSAVGALLAGGAPSIEDLILASAKEAANPAEWPGWDLDALVDKGQSLLDLWAGEVWATYARDHGGVYAYQLELHFEIDGIPYHVHLDVTMNDGSVIDLKTSEKRLADRAADKSVQLTTYAYAVRAVYGQHPPVVGLDGLIYANAPQDVRAWNPEASKPWYDRQRSTRSPAQLAAFREDVLRREEARRWADRTGIVQTNGRGLQAFVCDRCPAIAVCPSWAGTNVGEAVLDAPHD